MMLGISYDFTVGFLFGVVATVAVGVLTCFGAIWIIDMETAKHNTWQGKKNAP